MSFPPRRLLIVNADDFGLSEGINAGILEAFDRGIVTSASLMVRHRAADDAVRRAAERPTLGLGLHLDLGEWVHDGSRWVEVYEVVDSGDEAEVSAEVERQLARFRRMTGRNPSHLDSHQHVHREEPVRAVVARAARKLGVPARHVTPGIEHRGDFHGQSGLGESLPGGVGVARLLDILSGLPAGITELGCHPGRDPELDSPYREERAWEVLSLTDPRVRRCARAEGIELVSFAAPSIAREGVLSGAVA